MGPNFFIAIGVFILLYLLLREVNAWYWKINERIKLMERQAVSLQRIENRLEELIEHLGKATTSEPNDMVSSEHTDKDFLEMDDSKLTDSEKEKVQYLIKKMSKGDVITKHKINGNIEIMSLDNYYQWIKLYGEDMVEIIVKKA